MAEAIINLRINAAAFMATATAAQAICDAQAGDWRLANFIEFEAQREACKESGDELSLDAGFCERPSGRMRFLVLSDARPCPACRGEGSCPHCDAECGECLGLRVLDPSKQIVTNFAGEPFEVPAYARFDRRTAGQLREAYLKRLGEIEGTPGGEP